MRDNKRDTEVKNSLLDSVGEGGGAFLSLLAILWNSAFKWVYLSFSPLLFAFLVLTAICQDMWVTIRSTVLTMNKTDTVLNLTDSATVHKYKVDSNRDYSL